MNYHDRYQKMNNPNNFKELDDLRSELDGLDEQIIDLLGRRFRIVEKVAEIKMEFNIDVVQKNRMKEVLESRSAHANNSGVCPRLVKRLYNLIIAEACRLENDLIDGNNNQTLRHQAIRIDHVAIAVNDLEKAISFYRDVVGFELVDEWSIDGEFSGMNAAIVEAGGVTFVLVEGTSQASNVSKYIKSYGPGVQHIAIEVEDIVLARNALEGNDFPFIGGTYEANGLQQIFSTRNENSGIQLELCSRNSISRFEPDNVMNLFDTMDRDDVF